MISDTAKHTFQEIVWEYYRSKGRHDMPWRQPDSADNFDQYKIMVSEIMLQQTQVARAILKYEEFLEAFPTISDLAKAEQGDVLRVWSGLGYNRRAKYLYTAAQMVVNDLEGIFPDTTEELIKLPGIGQNTAGAILAYAYNKPISFIETNIRTAYIHHFFDDLEDVHDKDILKFVTETVDHENPREWYWALMDYGSSLKQAGSSRNHQSKHYAKRSKFVGSKRQIRGQVLRSLSDRNLTVDELEKGIADHRVQGVINDLIQEGLVQKQGDRLSL